MKYEDYAPVGKSEVVAVAPEATGRPEPRGRIGRAAKRTAAAGAPATLPQPPAPPPVATFIPECVRERRIVLDWPIVCEGRTYSAITVFRPSAGELGRYFEMAKAGAATEHLPMYRDDAGDPVPDAVLFALDDDDDVKVHAAATDFLPRRLRRFVEAMNGSSLPATGASPAP